MYFKATGFFFGFFLDFSITFADFDETNFNLELGKIPEVNFYQKLHEEFLSYSKKIKKNAKPSILTINNLSKS